MTPEDGAPTSAPTLTHIRDLLAEPDGTDEWVVDGLLPAGGASVLAGKPKAGKSTTARAMALRVSRGQVFLGRTTTQGPVIYLSLEDPRRVTREHFRALGAVGDDDLYVFTGQRPTEAMRWLEEVLQRVDPVLLVADTLQHLLGVSDLNDYARVVGALGPVLGLVRSRRAHVLLVHHAVKGDRSGFDSILGSVGIVGTVDVALLQRRREDGTRTLASLQRAGVDLPEAVLLLDGHREPLLGPPRQEYDLEQASGRVLEWLGKQLNPVVRQAVIEGVGGDTAVTIRALYRLVDGGKVTKTGKGQRGDPFLFGCFPPMEKTTKQQTENAGKSPNDAAEGCLPESGVLVPSPKQGKQEVSTLGQTPPEDAAGGPPQYLIDAFDLGPEAG